jgi:nucleoside-diphosphate-sugar epimerase
MRILVLGGTGWLSHEIAVTAVARQHAVTCVARRADIPDGARSVSADRDRDDALASVATEHWDAVIDVARQPGHVRRAVRDLAPVVDRYLFVSTASVYADHAIPGADESAERLSPLAAEVMNGLEDYGAAKVAGEDAVLAGFGTERTLIVRPGLIGGPGDPTGRTDYWPWRFAHPAVQGAVLVPEAPELPTSVIDVRDLAAWLVSCVERSVMGTFNAQGPAVLFPEHLDVARQAAVSDARPVSAPGGWLLERGVNEWAGPRSLPLWLADPSWYGMNTRSTDRARAAGLTTRPLIDTLRDALAWRELQPDSINRGAGLTDAEERELLAALAGPAA